ncbi:hypothetical protein Plhal304r1_c006g0024071 [Plasmopara halstedii]
MKVALPEKSVLVTTVNVLIVEGQVILLGTAECLCRVGIKHRVLARNTADAIKAVGSNAPHGRKWERPVVVWLPSGPKKSTVGDVDTQDSGSACMMHMQFPL